MTSVAELLILLCFIINEYHGSIGNEPQFQQNAGTSFTSEQLLASQGRQLHGVCKNNRFRSVFITRLQAVILQFL
jgi:hypothetical protein